MSLISTAREKFSFRAYVENRLLIPEYLRSMAGDKFILSKEHERVIRMIQDNQFTVFEAYRGFGKTMLVSYAFLLWRAEMWHESGIIFSANQELAYQKLDIIRNAIEIENPLLSYMCSKQYSSMTWNRGEIWLIDKMNPITKPDGTQAPRIMAKIYARSIEGTSRGLHVVNIVGDDIVVESNSSSYELKELTKKQFFAATVPIRMLNSKMIVVGTPQAGDDLLSELVDDKNPMWAKAIVPVYNGIGDPTCPELGHGKEWISQQRQLQGSLAFQQEYMLKPINDVTSIFKPEILELSKMTSLNFKFDHTRHPREIVIIGSDYVAVDDKRKAEKSDTDYFALVAVSFNMDTHKRRILNIFQERGVSFSQQLTMTRLWVAKFDANYLAIESHSFLQWAKQELESTLKSLPIFDTGSKSGKFDLYEGIPSMLYAWENGYYEVPYGDDYTVKMADVLYAQMRELSKAAHDDVADALFRAEKVCQQMTNTASYDKNFALYQRKSERRYENKNTYNIYQQ